MENHDPRLSPILTVGEVSRLVEVKAPTLYTWLHKSATNTRAQLVHGTSEPLHRGWPSVSVIGLAEAHTAHVLRQHYWSMPKLIQFAEKYRKRYRFPLAIPNLVTDGVDVFIEQDEDLSRLWDGQIPFSEIVGPLLHELVPWDDEMTGAYRPKQLADESEPSGQKLVEIDPRYNSGRMSFTRNRVPLFAVAGAMSAGESAERVAAEFRLDPAEVSLVERHIDWLLEAA
jgi:uncharacterized protein (DUF433 family)